MQTGTSMLYWTCLVLLGAGSVFSEQSGELKTYGNVIPRNFILGQSAKRTYVDNEVQLGWGILYKYNVYVGNYTLASPIPVVRLQIWTLPRDDFLEPELKLKWEVPLVVDRGINRLYEILIPSSSAIEITSKDRLGLTGEDSSCPIALDYEDSYRTYFRRVSGSQFPEVGDEVYIFDSATLPTRFSIGITVTSAIPTEDDQQYCGTQIKERPRYVEGGAQRVWLDKNIQLVEGVLDEVVFFAADVPEDGAGSQPNVSMQIWTPVVGNQDQFILKWKHTVPLDKGLGRLYKIAIEESASTEVTADDKLAWAFMGQIGHIAYTFSPTHHTHYCSSCLANGLPATGETFTFDQLGQPFEFSAGVLIRPGAKLPTGGASTVTPHQGGGQSTTSTSSASLTSTTSVRSTSTTSGTSSLTSTTSDSSTSTTSDSSASTTSVSSTSATSVSSTSTTSISTISTTPITSDGGGGVSTVSPHAGFILSVLCILKAVEMM